MLDGKANLEKSDLERRNSIATLLSDWCLIEIQNKVAQDCAPLRTIKIIGSKRKTNGSYVPSTISVTSN